MPYADSSGTRIFWDERGTGEPLLLIMGLGYSHDMWHRTTPIVSEHYRTILFDNRGIGKSEVPPGPYSIAAMASDAAAVLDAAGIARARVFGISMGGMIAQEFALAYPQRVEKLALGCTACGGPSAVRAEPEVNRVLMNRGNMSMDEAIEAMIPYIYDPHTPRPLIDEDLAIRRRIYPTAAAYNAQLQAILAWQSFDRLSQISAPTLVVHGLRDRLVPPGNGELIAGGIPGAKWAPLEGASHIFTTDQTAAAHAVLLDFLK